MHSPSSLAAERPAWSTPTAGIYTGTIGRENSLRYEIYVLLKPDSKTGIWQGEYFYLTQRKSIKLRAVDKKDYPLKLDETSPQGKITGHWSLFGQPSHRLTGFWKKVPVTASTLEIELALKAGTELSAWEKLITTARPDPTIESTNRRIRLENQGKPVLIEAYRFKKVFSKSHSELGAYILVDHGTPSVRTKVNARIQQELEQQGCAEQGGEWQETAEVTYANRDIISESIEGSGFCGGAHPSENYDWLSFDVKTGAELTPIALFTNYSANSDKIMMLAFKDFTGPEVENPYNTPDHQCPDKFPPTEIKSWASDIQMRIVKDGIELYPQLSYAIRACAPRVTVPFNKLLPFANSDGVIARLSR